MLVPQEKDTLGEETLRAMPVACQTPARFFHCRPTCVLPEREGVRRLTESGLWQSLEPVHLRMCLKMGEPFVR